MVEEVLDFLDRLMRNNNREWFLEHKAEYDAVQQKFNVFTEELIKAVGAFDASIANLKVKDCTYRIYKDLRFSKDKIPYKTHMGAYLCPHGKKSGLAGYYFHLEPPEAEYIGRNLLAAGLYNPTPIFLREARRRIAENGKEFVAALEKSPHLTLEENAKLSRVPKDYPQNHPFAEYLKLKDYSISMTLPDEILYGERLAQNVAEYFRETMPFNHYLNSIGEDLLFY